MIIEVAAVYYCLERTAAISSSSSSIDDAGTLYNLYHYRVPVFIFSIMANESFSNQAADDFAI